MERSRQCTWPGGIAESDFKQKKVSHPIAIQAEHRRTTHRREAAILVNGIYKDTGCVVVAHWDKSTIKRFDVYTGVGSKSATVAINTWITRGGERSKESPVWAKTPAFNHTQWYQEELERQAEERLEFFLGPEPEPQEGEPIRVKIAIDWPQDLLNHEITPRVVFGNELQALNDIRKRDEVWIIPLPNHSVQISGFDIMNVETAESHYKTMVARIRTEKCSVQQTTNMVLDEREGIDVLLLRSESWWPNRIDTVVPRLLPSPMMDQPGRFREDGLHDAQLTEIRDAMKRALEAASFRKGTYDFVVRLGCIALDSKKMGEDQIGKKHGKEKFVRSINGKVDLVSKRWLFDSVLGTQLYRHFVTMNYFLEPIKSAGYWGIVPASLEKTRPTLLGTWVFLDPNHAQKQTAPPFRNASRPATIQQVPTPTTSSTLAALFVVTIDWTDDGEGSYDKTGTKFFRLEPGKGGARSNMDIKLLELGESRAWSFALESMTPMSPTTVSPVLRGFAQRTTLIPGYNASTSVQRFAQWDQSSSIKALMIHECLDEVHSFGIRNTNYKVELTAMWYPKQSLPCWGLAVRHNEWASHLAELERLQTGHQASWGTTFSTFLPADGGSSVMLAADDDVGPDSVHLDDAQIFQQSPSCEGIRTLTDILFQLSKIVSAATLGKSDMQL